MREAAPIYLPEDRYFGPEPHQKAVATHLYKNVANLPLICPHGHVDPRLFSNQDYRFGTPSGLFIIPDHYVFRMLYSQGISLESLGIPSRGEIQPDERVDQRKVWQIFAENYYLFNGTPTGVWLNYELHNLFGVRQKLNGETAQDIYNQIAEKLAEPSFTPRQLYERFNIEVLCTTDSASAPLEYHRAIRESGWKGRILPAFRPDGVINLNDPEWKQNIAGLSQASGVDVSSYRTFIQALEKRRAEFKSLGAVATDHAAMTPYTAELAESEAEAIFQRALQAEATADDAVRFTGHMLIEMARMSVEDGLVMQLHAGALRDYNSLISRKFGKDKGADIPVPIEFTRNLRPLLEKFGNDTRLRLILFTLDETTYGRELAPLAGHYPSVRLGPPWWFYDSLNGMERYFEQVMETAGIYNTVGFNDDTRAFASIPARHDVWRRASANWLAGLVVKGLVDLDDAEEMVKAMAYGLAKDGYRLNEAGR